MAMPQHRTSLLLITMLSLAITQITVSASAAMHIEYPPAPTGDTVDDFHGVKVADPYRWLEDLNSPETKAWVTAENQLTFGYLDQIPGRDRLLARLKEVVNYPRFSLPSQTAGRYFYTKNDGLQNHSVLYVSEGLDGAPRVLLDPNTWSADGTVALAGYDVSDDGKWLLYGRSSSGSDWIEWSAKSIDTGAELPDLVKWSKGGGIWNKDASGFTYECQPEPKPGEEYTIQASDEMVRFHRLGTPQSADPLVFSLPEHPDWYISAGLNEERDMYVFYASERGSVNNHLYFQDLSRPGAPVERTLDANDAQYGFVTSYGRKVLIQTTLDAPNQRVVEIDLDHPQRENWREIIPEQPMALRYISTVGGYLFAHYLRDAHTATYKYRPDGTLVGEIAYPGPGIAYGFGGRKGDRETFYGYQDMVTPESAFRYDVETGAATLYRKTQVPLDTSRFETRQEFYRAKDGMAIPVFLVYKKGLKLDGGNPTILYGYGGFSAPQQPYFSTSNCVWLELGGVLAIACIRGGGEYGEAWHEAATKTRKQVCFDDFIAAAEYLIEQRYTCRERLAIWGHSNGGLLIGAVMTQRPDLCGVAIPSVGVLDMLRFTQWGYGGYWESDYGSPDNPDEFKALLAYSPYHNLHPGARYPATLVTTGDTDDRVMPAHSYKFAARLQACQAADGPPVLIRVETSAGHGAGKPLDKTLAETCDIYAFCMQNMGQAIPADFE